MRLTGDALWLGLASACMSRASAKEPRVANEERGGFLMFQITDTNWGYKGPANPDPAGAVERAVAEIAKWPTKPALVVHTGDVPDPASRPRSEVSERGFHVLSWARDGFGLALDSDVSWDDLRLLEARLAR